MTRGYVARDCDCKSSIRSHLVEEFFRQLLWVLTNATSFCRSLTKSTAEHLGFVVVILGVYMKWIIRKLLTKAEETVTYCVLSLLRVCYHYIKLLFHETVKYITLRYTKYVQIYSISYSVQ